MEIKEISYREMTNTGNYDNVTLEMTAVLNEKDDVDLCTEKLKRKVRRHLKVAAKEKEESNNA